MVNYGEFVQFTLGLKHVCLKVIPIIWFFRETAQIYAKIPQFTLICQLRNGKLPELTKIAIKFTSNFFYVLYEQCGKLYRIQQK